MSSALKSSSSLLAVLLLAGCGVSQTPQPSIGASGENAYTTALALPGSFVPAPHRSHGKSWMHRRKNETALLYVSDDGTGAVEVYDYTTGAEVGEATGFEYPSGECSNKKGDVYVVDQTASTISEFPYGSTTIKRTLTDGVGAPVGCSINPKNGDLAVSNYVGKSSKTGSVLIYPKASGTPTQYVGPFYYWVAGYDRSGNLFVEGEGGNCSGICLEELPAGGGAFSVLSLGGFTIGKPGAVEWDGKYLGVGDQMFRNQFLTGIYRVTVTGTTATMVSSTGLTSTNCDNNYVDVAQWAQYGEKPNDLPTKATKLIAAGNLLCDNYFGFWRYPKPGFNNPLKVWTGPQYATGQTIVIKVK